MPASETPAADRVVVALVGSALAGLVVGAVDVGWASGGVPSLRLALSGIGLMAPLALFMGCSAAAARVLLLPPSFPRLGALVARVRALPEDERRALAVRAVVAPLAALVAVVFAARVALRSLASAESAATSGAAMGLATAGLGALAVLATVALRASPPLHRIPPNPIALGGAAVALAVAAFLVLVALGTTSGAGGLFALFGVFKRQELDLRGVSLLLVLLLGGLLVPAWPGRVPRWALALVAVLPLGLVPYAALSGLDDKSALAVERKAPLGKRVLPALRRASDRDRDGASAWFAGGDCAEGNAKVGPTADDVPGNGIDEDCSGSDAAPVLARPSAPPPRSAAALAEIKQRIPEKPNVVLITIDALRAELGYMGYPRPISPSIDELAKKSAVFENAYSLASYTSKSLGPMLIGRYGMETHRGYLHFNRFTRADTFLSERLKGAGIRTVSVQGHWYFFKNYGFERGYDVLDTEATPADQPIEGDRSTNGDKLSDRIIYQLSRPELADKQFFLWSHYIDPHAEYVPHDGFDFGTKGRDRYDGEIAFVDHHFGRVLKALAASPFAARTVVIVTSDHGEAFGEHDLYRHGFELWEELVRVPLVIYVPGLEGRRIKVRRSAIDIVPTVLEILGIERPKPDAKDALRGESLLPDLVGPLESLTERPIFIDMPGGPYNDERQAYIENGLKLVTSMGRTLSLFDLASDPGERRDLSDDKARLRPLLDKTKAFRRSLDEVVERPK